MNQMGTGEQGAKIAVSSMNKCELAKQAEEGD